jgi:hypothetical protein
MQYLFLKCDDKGPILQDIYEIKMLTRYFDAHVG